MLALDVAFVDLTHGLFLVGVGVVCYQLFTLYLGCLELRDPVTWKEATFLHPTYGRVLNSNKDLLHIDLHGMSRTRYCYYPLGAAMTRMFTNKLIYCFIIY